MARLTRPLLVLAPLLAASLLLSSCGTGGAVADARTSCTMVHHAIVLQRQSEAAGVSAPARVNLQSRALSELLRATPSAAAATSADGSWNPLMTTINEAERVPFDNLIPALTRLCAVASSTTPYL